MSKNLSIFFVGSLLWICSMGGLLAESKKLSFNEDIRPILSENCYLCHGFDEKKRKAKLRLDTFEGATSLKKGRAAIVPGSPEKSMLVERIETHDPDELMPPPDTAYQLSEKEKAMLKQWIKEGAEYQEHWAYLAIEKNVSGNMDQHLNEKRIERGLAKGVKADPRTLIRRLSFDLRGLPPTMEEVQDFEKDSSENNYKKIVKNYLSSMEYAENQALKWLDLVRWANTTGMVSDEPFASDAYRNYVIKSFHDNVPFDTFTIEQLAGDLIEKPTTRSLVASGYNRIVKTNCEAGVIEEEALYDMKGEHVRALGTVWLGLTTGCAECHDHKYDPITQQDYYNMAAFFDDLIEAGCYTPGDRRIPLHYVHDKKEDQTKDGELYAELQKQYQKFYQLDRIDKNDYEKWQQEKAKALKASGNQIDYAWLPAQLPYAHEQSGAFKQVDVKGRQARYVTAKKEEKKSHFVAETLRGFFGKGVAKDKNNKGIYVDLLIEPNNIPTWIAIQALHGAYGRIGWKDSETITFVWADSEDAYKKDKSSFKSSHIKYMGTMPSAGQWSRLYVDKKTMAKATWHLTGVRWLQSEGGVYWGETGLTATPGKVEEYQMGIAGMRMFHEKPYHRMDYDKRFSWPARIVKKSKDSRTETEHELLKRCYLEQRYPKRLRKMESLEYELSKLRSSAQEVLVSRAGQPKMTRVLARGDFMDRSGVEAIPAIPVHFGVLPNRGKRATRLDLAHWLVDSSNPLTARVFVNRLWAQFFGKGFSSTLEDIGSQGEWPSHPKLIDKLAHDFIQSGWNIQFMIEKIVTSEAYKTSSMPFDNQIEKDVENRYLSRQNRFRYHAEAIRDHALQVSGLLQPTHALPKDSKFFYQPDAYWKLSSKVMYGSRHMIWDTHQGSEQHYRSLYGFYKRQNAHPTFLAFDAPTRQECSTHRTITNTPAQALTMLNDPIFVEAAQSMARSIYELPGSIESKLEALFEKSLQRQPNEMELRTLRQLYLEQKETFQKHPDEMEALAGQQQLELATWIIVSRVVLNLHETITRL